MEPPGYIKCGCGQVFPMTIANTVITSYWYQPWFAWARAMCSCGEVHKNFFGPKHWQEQCERFTEAGIGFVVENYYAEPHLIMAYTDVYQQQLDIPTAVDLDQAAERYVQFFAYLLERGETP